MRLIRAFNHRRAMRKIAMQKINQIRGLHHVTSFATEAQTNGHFHQDARPAGRVKKPGELRRPDVYHLYYERRGWRAWLSHRLFPFPDISHGGPETGEVGETVFRAEGSLPFFDKALCRARRGRPQVGRVFRREASHLPGPTAMALRWSKPEETALAMDQRRHRRG